MQNFFENAIITPLQNLLTNIYDFLPNLFAMLLILFVGLIAGLVLKRLIVLLLRIVKFDRLSFRLGFSSILEKAGVRRSPKEMIGTLVYWLFFFVFLMLALNALKLQALDVLITEFFLFLPDIISGLILFFVGYLISIFIERTVLITAVNAGLTYARLLARGAQILVLIFFVAIALEQIGIGQNIVLAAFAITFGGVVLAVALALGLGGRELGREWLEQKLGKNIKENEEKDVWSHI